MLVNARLLYILVDGLHYSLGGQVILTVACFYMSETPYCRDTHHDHTVHVAR